MFQVSLGKRAVFGACGAALSLFVALFACSSSASAAMPYSANGVVNACYKVKGKEKGALRLVKSSRRCKRMRGWRRVSWSAVGPTGASGPTGNGSTGAEQHGPAGPAGQAGPQGESGAPGLVDDLEKSLLDTIQDQADQIDALTTQVNGLTTQLAALAGLPEIVDGLSDDVEGLEDVVGVACDQLGVVTGRSDELLGTLENSSIGGSLPIVGSVVGLLELVLTDLPEAPLGSFEGCTAP